MPDVFEHMSEAWKLKRNPFPAEAIRIQNAPQPYSASVFPDEAQEFRIKFIRGGTHGGLAIGFLWSQGKKADTGFGKTTLMQALTVEINEDLGAKTLEMAGEKKDERPAIAAAFSNLNNLNATGFYPVLFNAVTDLATATTANAKSVFEIARERIVQALQSDNAEAIAEVVGAGWTDIGGTCPLRPELVAAFSRGGGLLKIELTRVSATTRLRYGLQYMDFALAVLAAAKVPHLFLMIDQLEDLATNRSITVPKRSREVGRIRDALECMPYATRLHMIFTFHNRAAQVLERDWEENRLPQFEASSSNTSSVIVLKGLKDVEQTTELLRVYLDDARIQGVEDDLLPFEPAAVEVLRVVSDGRPGVVLNRARELLNAAAEQELPTISGRFARRHFDHQAPEDSDGAVGRDQTMEDIDALLLGIH